jgi:hypothetical protein
MGIQVSSNKGPGPLQWGDNHKNVKIGWGHLKSLFSRITGSILTRLSTNPWVERIQVCSNEGDIPSSSGDNTMKFSRTSMLNSIKLDANYPWVKGIQVCSNKGPGPLQRGK